jgi:hypothetical protein
MPLAGLAVSGVGILAMPLPEVQFEQLAAMAVPTPHGRGPDTIYDDKVRRSLQIGADRVDGSRPRWQALLAEITRLAATGLGAETATAGLYKLLLYRPGDFFLPHRDTEKVPGMFGTLVIALPSAFAGAALVVRHAGHEKVVLQGAGDPETLQWAAFYADCQHEVKPLLQGHRAVLVYSLVRHGGPLPEPPQCDPTIAALQDLLSDWADGDDGPVKLVMPLEHQYSLAELAFDKLKGQDAAMASALLAAARPDEFAVRLATYAQTESGSAEEVYYGRRSRWEAPPEVDDYEVVDINDSSRFIADLVSPLGPDGDWGSVDVEDGELAPPDCLEGEPWDEDEYSEATGNEGASFERAYRRTALVIWPLMRELAVVAQGGTLAMANAIERYAALPGQGNGRAARLGLALLRSFPRPKPEQSWFRARHRPEVLRALSLLEGAVSEASPMAVFLLDVIAAGDFHSDEAADVARAVQRAAPEIGRSAVAGIAATAKPEHAAAALQVVSALAIQGELEASRLAVAALLRRIAEQVATSQLRQFAAPNADAGRAFWKELLALAAVQPSCVSWPDVEQWLPLAQPLWPVDACLIPLLREGPPPPSPLARALASHVMLFVAARVAEPLEPPSTWARGAVGLTCDCSNCNLFRGFLGNPTAERWPFAAAQDLRSHIERAGAAAGLDVTFATIRQGRPHTLLLTKNSASYLRRVAQRKVDLEDLNWLAER